MEIKHPAVAGTAESSDAIVYIRPCEKGIRFSLTSPVIHQYGLQIKNTVLETLSALNVENADISITDNGALNCTLKARVEAAVFRGADLSEKDIPWGGAVK